MRRNRNRSERKGATLIELLVVAAIMLTLAAMSVPTIKPMMESQVTTRAASTVTTYLERARSRAIATGRPCGVQFEYYDGTYDPSADRGSASLVLRQVEIPPVYSGLTSGEEGVDPTGARVNTVDVGIGAITTITDVSDHRYGMRINQITRASDPYWSYFVDPDVDSKIQFNSIGPYYDVYCIGNVPYIVQIPGVELPTFTQATFKVIRSGKPRTTMTAPVGLPQGSVVDLEFSGTDSRSFAKGCDVTVMFAPTGELDYILDGDQKKLPGDTLYFLIGRWDRIAALGMNGTDSMAEDGLWNFEDPANFWVTLNPRTGVVSTVEVEQPFAYTLSEPFQGVVESRELARNSKRNVGGR